MKNKIIFEMLKNIKQKPKLMKKLKVFAVVGIVGFLITGALIVWAGISAINYVASSTNQIIQSPTAQGHVESLKTELSSLPKFQAINCWGKAQSLIAVQPWLERPVLDNFANLIGACFEHKPNPCQGTECEQMKKIINTTEGSFI